MCFAIEQQMGSSPSSWGGLAIRGVKRTAEGVQCVQDVLSVVPGATSLKSGIPNPGGVNNGLGLLFGISDLKKGWSERQRAGEIEDQEGVSHANEKVLSSAIAVGGTVLYFGDRFATCLDASAGLVAGLDSTTRVIGGIGSLLAMGVAGWGLHRCWQFQAGLNGLFYDWNVRTEAERCRNALEYLKNAMCVTDEERRGIEAQTESTEWKKKTEQRIEAKRKALQRRTSQNALLMIQNRFDLISQKLSDPDRSRKWDGIIETHQLVGDINAEIEKKLRLHFVCCLVAVISLVAILIGTICTAGAALPYLLSALSTTICLFVAAYDFHMERKQNIQLSKSS